MKEIKLSQGKVAIVDDEDYEFLSQWKWTAILHHTGSYYVSRKIRLSDGTRKNVHMHRVVINAPENKKVDHINGNPLDNRKSNLRLATSRQNSQNKKVSKINTTGHTGVSVHTKNKTWIARITNAFGKRIHLGSFYSFDEAVSAREKAEEEHHGEFSRRRSTSKI